MNILNTLNHRHSAASQTGAALVVALILLVALSLMAISSMNTATLDLVMAGNEQYRNRAFVAAEAGIEHGMDFGTLDSSNNYTQASTAAGAGVDAFNYTITRPNGGAQEEAPEFNTANQGSGFKRITFRITSTGGSERGATATHVQELYRVIRGTDAVTADDNCGAAAAANLDGTVSGC